MYKSLYPYINVYKYIVEANEQESVCTSVTEQRQRQQSFNQKPTGASPSVSSDTPITKLGLIRAMDTPGQ